VWYSNRFWLLNIGIYFLRGVFWKQLRYFSRFWSELQCFLEPRAQFSDYLTSLAQQKSLFFHYVKCETIWAAIYWVCTCYYTTHPILHPCLLLIFQPLSTLQYDKVSCIFQHTPKFETLASLNMWLELQIGHVAEHNTWGWNHYLYTRHIPFSSSQLTQYQLARRHGVCGNSKTEAAIKLRLCKRNNSPAGRAFRTSESESESADFSEVRVRKFRTLKTLRTRTQRVCLFTHLYCKEVKKYWWCK
jgi:hypothetical protein